MYKYVNIRLTADVHKELESLKLHPKQSFNELVFELIKEKRKE